MWINSIKVSGEYQMQYDFNRINILLGENGTGKSTFTKLVLYGLGVDIPDFIEEIVKLKLCDAVYIDFNTKSNNRYKCIRKLPYADMVMVTPYIDGKLNDEEVHIYNLVEYSDFLLEEEDYSKQQVAYGNNQTASFRYRFVLRTAVVDQSTPHGKILANLGGSGNDYLSNQKLINKAIIENILKQNDNDKQRIRLELKNKEKKRIEIRDKINFYKELSDHYKESDEKYPFQLDSIRKEVERLQSQKDNLTTREYETLLKLEHTSDKRAEQCIIKLRKELNELKEEQTRAKIEVLDVEEVLKKLLVELEEMKANIAAKKVLQNIPVTICPVCFSEITERDLEEGMCPKCHEYSENEALESLALYKKMIEDSIKEAKSLKRETDEKLIEVSAKIKDKEKRLNKIQKDYFNNLQELKEPLEKIIQEIKEQIDIITSRYYKLIELKKIIVEKNKLNSEKEKLATEINELSDELEEANKKTANEILVFEKWKDLYQKLFQKIYSKTYSLSISSEDYMPIINGNPMNRISSESMKLVARLSYILSLLELSDNMMEEKINSVGIAVFDSPKDKDLDNNKYIAFLKELKETKSGQIFLTGSVLEKNIYESIFDKESFLIPLTEESRLLKPTDK